MKPYVAGGLRVWYRFEHKKVSKNYLQVLLQADQFIAGGLRAVHHNQIEAQLGTTEKR